MAGSLGLVSIVLMIWTITRSTPALALSDLQSVADELSMDRDRLNEAIRRVDTKRFRGATDRIVALGAWSEAYRGRHTGERFEIEPYLRIIQSYEVLPSHDPFEAEDPDEVILVIGALWALSQTWRSTGLYSMTAPQVASMLSPLVEDRDEVVGTGVALVARVVLDDANGRGSPELYSLYSRLMQNDLVAKMVDDKIRAWDRALGRGSEP